MAPGVFVVGLRRVGRGIAIASIALLSRSALAGIGFGQLDSFSISGNPMGWTEGAASPNPPTVIDSGGPEGAGDGYLSNTATGGFSAGAKQVMFNTSQWAGDYVTAGVTRIEMKLANLGTTPLSIRVALSGGTFGGTRFASTNAFALPAGSSWTTATFQLSSSALTPVLGSDSADQVLGSVSELRILSSGAPAFNGDGVASVLGVDSIRALRLPGDATFDGAVNFDDLVKVAQNYNRSEGVTWRDGDFTFDGSVNFDDLVILAQNYNSSGAVTDVGGDAFSRDWALASSLVPEPGLAVISAGGLATAGRRRRRAPHRP